VFTSIRLRFGFPREMTYVNIKHILLTQREFSCQTGLHPA
jgi:hypothetical protein